MLRVLINVEHSTLVTDHHLTSLLDGKLEVKVTTQMLSYNPEIQVQYKYKENQEFNY